MRDYCTKCPTEVDETDFSQNQAEFQKNPKIQDENALLLCSKCIHIKNMN